MSGLFTIEQIDLIRRLLKTGITRSQICDAIDEIIRVESGNSRLDLVYLSNVETFLTPAIECKAPQLNISNVAHSESSNRNSATSFRRISQVDCDIDSIRQNHSTRTPQQTVGTEIQTIAPPLTIKEEKVSDDERALIEVKKEVIDEDKNDEESRLQIDESDDSKQSLLKKDDSVNNTKIVSFSAIPIFLSTSKSNESDISFEINRDSSFQSKAMPELDKFKMLNETDRMLIIKRFTQQYNIRQNMIAEMTRISQAYISKFFRGDANEMSDRVKNIIYMWYLKCKKDPSILKTSCSKTMKDKNILNERGELLPIKRDRFIFRTQHLAILEKYFIENQYPDLYTKEEIAEKCNQATAEITKNQLQDKDKVTVAIVSNWFNNKRKELKQTFSGKRRKRDFKVIEKSPTPPQSPLITQSSSKSILDFDEVVINSSQKYVKHEEDDDIEELM
ncbi:homeobox-containing protein 1-like protein, partial [Dinothrombium tinctorium]